MFRTKSCGHTTSQQSTTIKKKYFDLTIPKNGLDESKDTPLIFRNFFRSFLYARVGLIWWHKTVTRQRDEKIHKPRVFISFFIISFRFNLLTRWLLSSRYEVSSLGDVLSISCGILKWKKKEEKYDIRYDIWKQQQQTEEIVMS